MHVQFEYEVVFNLLRWDISEIDQLPEYMKTVYKFVLSTYQELEHEASKRARTSMTPYGIEAVWIINYSLLQLLFSLNFHTYGFSMITFSEPFSGETA